MAQQDEDKRLAETAGGADGEVKDEKRGMLRATVAATALINALYVFVNWAFWYGLGVSGLAASIRMPWNSATC